MTVQKNSSIRYTPDFLSCCQCLQDWCCCYERLGADSFAGESLLLTWIVTLGCFCFCLPEPHPVSGIIFDGKEAASWNENQELKLNFYSHSFVPPHV